MVSLQGNRKQALPASFLRTRRQTRPSLRVPRSATSLTCRLSQGVAEARPPTCRPIKQGSTIPSTPVPDLTDSTEPAKKKKLKRSFSQELRFDRCAHADILRRELIGVRRLLPTSHPCAAPPDHSTRCPSRKPSSATVLTELTCRPRAEAYCSALSFAERTTF